MELNPNHPATSSMREQWHKIALILMHKMGEKHVVITSADIMTLANMYPGDLAAITVCDKVDGLHLKMMSMTEGQKLAREEGGLAT